MISPTPPPSGSFVLGDQHAAPGAPATFWAAQWPTLNGLSGGLALASFKGFANQTPNNPPRCGDHWTTAPGGSSSPPATVPQYMEVIVASRITQQGATIAGDTQHVVVV